MNPHLERALLLLQQSRHELAEQELRQTLGVEPNNALAHSMLAICLLQSARFQEAAQEAANAIHLAPDQSYGFYVQSLVFAACNRSVEALAAIHEAIRLDPFNPTSFAQLAGVHFTESRWRETLVAAEQGLAADPENVDCINWRAKALVKLGRKIDASTAIETALAHQPEDARSHANLGWALIEQGQYQKAMEHFREALRLNPEMDWARHGIVEAMKARYFIYRILLGYFLWMAKLSDRAQRWVILGGFLGYQFLRGAANQNPQLRPWLMPILIAYMVFALMTWVASPLFNLLLRLNRFGRLALSREQTITANWVGACVFVALLSLAGYFWSKLDVFLYAGVIGGLLIPPIAHVYHCDVGWPRTTIVLLIVGLLAIGLIAVGCELASLWAPNDIAAALQTIGGGAFLLFAVSGLLSQFAVNALVSARVRH